MRLKLCVSTHGRYFVSLWKYERIIEFTFFMEFLISVFNFLPISIIKCRWNLILLMEISTDNIKKVYFYFSTREKNLALGHIPIIWEFIWCFTCVISFNPFGRPKGKFQIFFWINLKFKKKILGSLHPIACWNLTIFHISGNIKNSWIGLSRVIP